ncbi:MAG: geranylgeranylglycerol-phosphate geranylgeranyltransferase, partial [Candidatus Latescibacteria bacterium]|nr:geranylgeranylglycerol-phosphate geranylgeranyltransferase [Candidatus Latescibacterota bacterium]
MSLYHTTTAHLQLIRPINGLMSLAAVQVGVFIAYGEVMAWPALMAGISAWCICGAANASNDYFDVDIDRVNKPQRPLAAGILLPGTALWLALLLGAAGIVTGAWLSPTHGIIALIAACLSWMYNAGWIRRGFAGNLTVSGVAATAFIYGGLLGSEPLLALVPTGFACFFHLGRELIKDIEDVRGDAKGQMRSIPVKHGLYRTLMVITAVFTILILITFIPIYYRWFGLSYAGMVVLVDGIMVYVLWSLWRDAS